MPSAELMALIALEQEGEQAQFEGIYLSACPYIDWRAEHWMRGWHEAKPVREQFEADAHAAAIASATEAAQS